MKLSRGRNSTAVPRRHPELRLPPLTIGYRMADLCSGLASASKSDTTAAMDTPPSRSAPRRSIPRIEAIDLARGAALVAMAIYHFTWDLEFFGYAPAGLAATGGWKLFARCIASSFLFLVGVSLFLAHHDGIRWRSFWRRLGMVAAAALAISVVTWFAVPEAFIFFGILHGIAVASLIGLFFLRLPALVTILAAVAVIAAPYYLRSSVFDHPAWSWLGLSMHIPRSNDYVPVFPWAGAVLLGIAAAKLTNTAGVLPWMARFHAGRWALPLKLGGQHSLAVYLIHQPVLLAGLWTFSLVFPAEMQTPEVRFGQVCQANCASYRDADFCTPYCVCMLDRFQEEGALATVFQSAPNDTAQKQIEMLAAECSMRTDDLQLGGQ